MERGGGPARGGRERARGPAVRCARRGSTRHRLRDRCAGRAERARRGPLSGDEPPADRLSGGSRRDCEKLRRGGLAEHVTLSSKRRDLRPRGLLGARLRTLSMSLSPEEWVAIRLSLKVALWATLASLPVAIAVAYALARGRFAGRALLDGFVHLPLVLPPVVT